jgi:hypothetical protein
MHSGSCSGTGFGSGYGVQKSKNYNLRAQLFRKSAASNIKINKILDKNFIFEKLG